jgi:hypothetical protein
MLYKTQVERTDTGNVVKKALVRGGDDINLLHMLLCRANNDIPVSCRMKKGVSLGSV